MTTGGRKSYVAAAASLQLPLYFQPWWLDAVAGEDGWDVVIAQDRGDKLTGVWVFCMKRFWGIRAIRMPGLTAYSGPLLFYPDNLTAADARYAFEKKVLKELLNQLPDVSFFYQEWHPLLQNWLPAYWRGYRQTTHYTYRLEHPADLNVAYKGFRSNVRNHIRGAEKTVRVAESDDLESLFRLYQLSLLRQGKKPPVSREVLQRADLVLRERNQRLMLLAEDDLGQIHAGIYLTWDSTTAYYLLSGTDPAYRSSGALYLLVWHAIQYAGREGLSFDFEGSMLEPVEEVFRGFGGKLTPHHKIFRAPNKLLQALATLLGKSGF
jgi:hypothetical protein